MSCKIYFAEQFAVLRRYCGIESAFIDSLTRSESWIAPGGKSGSLFLRTLDDKYILKQLSKFESESFLTFAPEYFKHMSESLFHNVS